MEPDSNPILEIIQRRVKQHKKKMMESAQEGCVSSDVMISDPKSIPLCRRKKKVVNPLQETNPQHPVEGQEQVGEQVQELAQNPIRRRKKKIVIPPQETSILSPVEGQEPIQEQEGQVHKPSFVYLLESSDKRSTYIGATIDLDHRLRQHNKELVGGAKATAKKVEKGCTWHRVLYVAGFPTWQAALQFEWRFKRLSSTKAAYKIKNPLERRLYGLRQLLALPASTSKAVPYAQWPSPPVVIWEPVLNMTREL